LLRGGSVAETARNAMSATPTPLEAALNFRLAARGVDPKDRHSLTRCVGPQSQCGHSARPPVTDTYMRLYECACVHVCSYVCMYGRGNQGVSKSGVCHFGRFPSIRISFPQLRLILMDIMLTS